MFNEPEDKPTTAANPSPSSHSESQQPASGTALSPQSKKSELLDLLKPMTSEDRAYLIKHRLQQEHDNLASIAKTRDQIERAKQTGKLYYQPVTSDDLAKRQLQVDQEEAKARRRMAELTSELESIKSPARMSNRHHHDATRDLYTAVHAVYYHKTTFPPQQVARKNSAPQRSKVH